MKLINTLISGFIVPMNIIAAPLEFPDSAGKIVGRTEDYIIRLVETPKSAVKTAEAIFFVKGSPRICLKVVSDFEHYPEFMPNIRSAEFVEKKDSCILYRFSFKVGIWTIRYCNSFKQRASDGGSYALEWDYVNGDLRKTSGSWDIRPCKDRAGYSIVQYKAFIDTGMFVPHWVSDLLTAKSIPKMIKAIAKRVKTEEAGSSL
jgi:ribosome-associated toxin RatA of RatAB toxin-antitoxin module